MSKDWYQDIVDFHKEVMQDDFPHHPYLPHPGYRRLRRTLIKEEIKETLHAMATDNIVEIADGIADSIVVLLGAAVTYGIDMRPIWDLVHESNMAKKGGTVRADGKQQKPEGWKPPDIARELMRQREKISL